MSFDTFFRCLTGHDPFPWQRALHEELVRRRFPTTCDIPTGLGKTAAIAVWLLALAHRARTGSATGFPRRLVYVVNRRTVVDQATREAERVREALCTEPGLRPVAEALRSLSARPAGVPLAISTLRGQFADNAEWRADPARPAVIVGTVDMIGSRLLFAGYGCGFRSRPLHAAFLGQDALLIHDEAHLEPAFQELLGGIESEQERCGEPGHLRVMALTATSRGGPAQLGITDSDRSHEEVSRRLGAKKGVVFHPIKDEKKTVDEVVGHALAHRETGAAILVFLHKVEQVEKVAGKLRRAKLPTQVLTGTLRGLERDALATQDAIFARFVRNAGVEPRPGTVCLVCTSAGEVGVDMSADHLVCDLTPFDSMAQRFGRVNRFGGGDARIDVVHGIDEEPTATTGEGSAQRRKPKKPFDEARARALAVLRRLPVRADGCLDASSGALLDLPADDRLAAFTPAPAVLPVSDILFDAWALTSVRGTLPGRPPVADWLHGVAEWEPPVTHVAWREEVGCIAGPLLDVHRPEDLLAACPLKPHELLRDRALRVFKHLEVLAARCPELSAWLVDPEGATRVLPLPELVARDRQRKPAWDLGGRTVVLPPEAGGLTNGMLDDRATFNPDQRPGYDVADQWTDHTGRPRRRRVWDEDEPPAGMRLVRTIDTRPDVDGDPSDEVPGRRIWRWYVRPRSADDDGSRTASRPQNLEPHLHSAERFAGDLVSRLGLPEAEASAVTLAARWHDLGKHRAVWQRSIGNDRYPGQVLAKGGGRMQPRELGGYRHELGSVIEVSSSPELTACPPETQDLVLHLIAAHHGRARPHFSAQEMFDPERPDEVAVEVAKEAPHRFARLTRAYGRWRLAYLESLVRAADVLASLPGDGHDGDAPLAGLAAAAPVSPPQAAP